MFFVPLYKHFILLYLFCLSKVGAGVVGLAFSVPELVINCVDVNNCKTEASQSLRKNAVDIRKASDQMEKDLKNIQ